MSQFRLDFGKAETAPPLAMEPEKSVADWTHIVEEDVPDSLEYLRHNITGDNPQCLVFLWGCNPHVVAGQFHCHGETRVMHLMRADAVELLKFAGYRHRSNHHNPSRGDFYGSQHAEVFRREYDVVCNCSPRKHKNYQWLIEGDRCPECLGEMVLKLRT